MRSALETYFIKCPKPNTEEITHIANELGLERDVSPDSKSARFCEFVCPYFLNMLLLAGCSCLVLQSKTERKAPCLAPG